MTSLQNKIKQSKDLDSIRCGGCGNSLVHCGKYVVIDAIEDTDPEGVLCETCQKNGRKLKGTIKKVTEKKEDIREKYKKIKSEEVIEPLPNPNLNVNKKENVEKEKEKKVEK